MPECLLWAYAEHLPRLQAERLRDASFVAAFPHMGKQGSRDWLSSLTRIIQRVRRDAHQGFSFNGTPVSVSNLRRRLRAAMGGGFTDE